MTHSESEVENSPQVVSSHTVEKVNPLSTSIHTIVDCNGHTIKRRSVEMKDNDIAEINSPPLCLFDCSTFKIVYVNEGFSSIIGIPKEILIGSSFLNLVAHEEADSRRWASAFTLLSPQATISPRVNDRTAGTKNSPLSFSSVGDGIPMQYEFGTLYGTRPEPTCECHVLTLSEKMPSDIRVVAKVQRITASYQSILKSITMMEPTVEGLKLMEESSIDNSLEATLPISHFEPVILEATLTVMRHLPSPSPRLLSTTESQLRVSSTPQLSPMVNYGKNSIFTPNIDSKSISPRSNMTTVTSGKITSIPVDQPDNAVVEDNTGDNPEETTTTPEDTITNFQLKSTPILTTGGAGSVLIVEDSAIALKLLMRLMIRLGYRVQTATNGEQALECLQKECFDLVLMDIYMPQMGGLEASHAIRSFEREIRAAGIAGGGRAQRILAMSAEVSDSLIQEVASAGFDAFIDKPLTEAKLLTALAQPLRAP